MSGPTSAVPYIGSKISLVTNSELRYEGILININTTNSTVTLRDVRMSGTENRKAPQYVMPSPEIFDYIIFNGKDIKDLTVSEPTFSIKQDPAVVAVNVAPSHLNGGYGNDQHPMDMMGGRHQAMDNMQPPMGYSSNGYSGRDYMDLNHSRGGYRGMGGMSGGGGVAHSSSKAVVGELTAQPNNNLKTQVNSAFDFEQSNSKFSKEKNAAEAAETGTTPTYDKTNSFFDNISCEALNRQHGRDNKLDREKQRELDTQTFGPSAALARGPRYYRRGYRRPANVGRGGRGGLMGYNSYKPNGGYYGNYSPQNGGYGNYNGNPSYGNAHPSQQHGPQSQGGYMSRVHAQ